MKTIAERLAAKRLTVTSPIPLSSQESLTFSTRNKYKEIEEQLPFPTAYKPDFLHVEDPAFPIEVFVQLILCSEPERQYYELNTRPYLLLTEWLGPFTKAPKVSNRQGISNWLSLYHVPLLAKWTEQDVLDFYALFYREAIKRQGF